MSHKQLKSIEKILNVAKCNDREKVIYASSCLIGPTTYWWDAYSTAHITADNITWAKLVANFRSYHTTEGLMKIKNKEFLSLKQGGMSLIEYQERFIQLSRYAPEDRGCQR